MGLQRRQTISQQQLIVLEIVAFPPFYSINSRVEIPSQSQ
jgi:hypothetical protein